MAIRKFYHFNRQFIIINSYIYNIVYIYNTVPCSKSMWNYPWVIEYREQKVNQPASNGSIVLFIGDSLGKSVGDVAFPMDHLLYLWMIDIMIIDYKSIIYIYIHISYIRYEHPIDYKSILWINEGFFWDYDRFMNDYEWFLWISKIFLGCSLTKHIR